MARRRAFGAGFDAAGSIIELYIKDKMQRARDSSRMAQQSQNQRMAALMNDLSSGNYSKLRPDDQQLYGEAVGFDLPIKTDDDVIQQSIAGLSEADTRAKLPTQEELVASVRKGGGMFKTGEQAVNAFGALQSRDAQLKNAEAPIAVDGMITDAAGNVVKGKRFERPADLAGQAFSTERTGAQEGQRAGQEAVAKNAQPGYLDTISDTAEATSAGQNASDYLDPDVFGKKVELARAQAEATAGARPATQAEHQAGEYANRFEQSEETFGDATFAHQIANMPLLKFLTESALPASAQSPEIQRYWQAAENLINAKLRDESGAVINASEFLHAHKQYLPQPGNTAEALNMKRENRRVARESAIRSAGKAYQPYVRQGPAASATYQSLFGK